MNARAHFLDQLIGVKSDSLWPALVRYAGAALAVFGGASLLLSRGTDPAWSLLLIGVGLLAQRVAAPTGLAMYAITFGWTALASGLFGRFTSALLLALLSLATLAALQLALRAARRPLPALPGLAWASLIVGVASSVILILAFGSSLLAFVTGWPLSAPLIDTLTSIGVHTAVAAAALAVAAFIQGGARVWPAVLGVIASGTSVMAFLGLFLFAQG